MINLSESAIARFWAKVSVASENACWEWQASKNQKGYGQMTIGIRPFAAHRISYTIHYGQIPKELFVCHHCDNRTCVNPKHLFLGTPKDNTQDMVRKGRACIGERNASTKLTTADVLEIRQLASTGHVSQKEISDRFGISRGAVGGICKGLRWKYAGGDRIKRFQRVYKSADAGSNLKQKAAKNKITAEQALEIRRLRNEMKLPAKEVAQIVGTTVGIVVDVSLGNSWKEVGGELRSRGQATGSDRPNAKLTEDDVREVRRLNAAGVSGRRLTEQFGVNAVTIHNIVHRKTWKHVH